MVREQVTLRETEQRENEGSLERQREQRESRENRERESYDLFVTTVWNFWNIRSEIRDQREEPMSWTEK